MVIDTSLKSGDYRIIGVGGGGCNSLHSLSKDLHYRNFVYTLNTDRKNLEASPSKHKLLLGESLTQGLGSGGNPEVGKAATEQAATEIRKIILGAKLVILHASMGGGTGTGGITKVAELCKEMGVVTIAIVTTPFGFEGLRRIQQAKEGIKSIENLVDAVVVLDNDNLRLQFGHLKIKEAFIKADELVDSTIRTILGIIDSRGHIIIDIDDIVSVLRQSGNACVSKAAFSGKNRAIQSIKSILSSFGYSNILTKARWCMIYISSTEGENECTMDELEEMNLLLRDAFGEDTDIIVGMGYDNSLNNKLSVSIIITGIQRAVLRASTDSFHTDKPALPFAIKQIYIQQYHSIKDVIITDIPVDSNWIFFTGANGSGKTSILQALFIGLNGKLDGEKILLTDKESKVLLEVKTPFGNLLETPVSMRYKEPYLACYGPSRLQVQSDYSKNEIDRKSTLSYSLFNTDGILLNIETELVLYFLNKDPLFKIVTQTIMNLVPEISKIEFENNEIFYQESNDDQRLRLSELPSGYKSIIAFMGDLIIRFAKFAKPAPRLMNFKGFVIIDELDLHWHPKWQRTIPKILSELFPNIQFIATTHSPLPFLGAPANSTFFKVFRTSNGSTQVEQIELDTLTLQPNLLLTSGLFDMDEIAHIENNDVASIHSHDKFQEIQDNKTLDEILKKFENSTQNYPDIKKLKDDQDQQRL